MNRRPIEYELIAGDVLAVKREVKRLVVQDGWWLHGELVRLNDTQVARELVKYAPAKYVMNDDYARDGVGTVPVRED